MTTTEQQAVTVAQALTANTMHVGPEEHAPLVVKRAIIDPFVQDNLPRWIVDGWTQGNETWEETDERAQECAESAARAVMTGLRQFADDNDEVERVVDRLASVSSASAEGVSDALAMQDDDVVGWAIAMVAKGGPHEWGYRDPVDGTFISDPWPFHAAEYLAKMSAPDTASPEPVPATNQAGEVAVEALAQFLHDEGGFGDAMTDRTWPEHDADTGQRENGWVKIVPSDVVAKFRDVARRWLLPCARKSSGTFANPSTFGKPTFGLDDNEAATQPATSQEGAREKLQQTCDLMSSLPPLIFSESEADHLIATIVSYAPTPTPPTLSEDLRKAVANARGWYGPVTSEEMRVALSDLDAALARAQVKAS